MKNSAHIPSSEQNKVIQSTQTLKNVTYTCPKNAIKTMGLMAIDNIQKDKNILFIIPDEKTRISLSDFLESSGMSDVLLSCKMYENVSHAEIEQIKKNTIDEKKNIQVNKQSHFEYERIKSSTNLDFRKKYSDKKDGKTWRNHVDEYAQLEADPKAKLMARYLNSAVCPKNEAALQNILDVVFEGMNYYAPTFESLEYGVLKNELNLSKLRLDDLNDITYEIFTWKEAATILRDRFLHASKNIEEDFLTAKLKLIQDLEYQVDFIDFEYGQWKSQPKKSNTGFLSTIFQNKQSKHEDHIKSIIDKCKSIGNKLQSLTPSHLSIPSLEADIVSYCEKQKAQLLELKYNLKATLPEVIKSVNRFNNDHPILTDLETELSALVEQINTQKILAKPLEINTLSFSKQVDFIVDLVSRFDRILSEIEHNIQYFQWCDFLDHLQDEEKQIITVLTRFSSSEWPETIKAWYLYHQITTEHLHFSAWSSEDKGQYFSQYNQYIAESIYNTVIDKQATKADILKSLKNTDPSLHKFLNEKNQKEQLTWRYIFTHKMPFLSKCYPIIITDGDDLADMKKVEDLHLVVFNKQDVNAEIMQLFDSITYFWNENDYQVMPDYRLIIKDETHKPHHLLATSERLGVVRTISHLLMSTQSLPTVYLMKNTCLLTYTSALINSQITAALHPLGIKKIYTNDDPLKMLIGALLEAENRIFILTEDHLMHPDHIDSILEQLNIIDQLEHYGCEMLNISSQEVFVSNDYLSHLIQTIQDAQVNENKTEKKQLTFEFI